MIGMKVLLFVFVVCLSNSLADESKARLLVSKTVLNQYLVESKDTTLEYVIYNVGGSTALNIQLEQVLDDDVKVVSGLPKVKWDRLVPGQNITHVLIVQPQRSGVFNFTSATVEYLDNDMATEKQIGMSSEPSPAFIMDRLEYERKYSPHLTDWATFVLMTLPSLGIPFVLWYRSKSKYDSILKAAKRS